MSIVEYLLDDAHANPLLKNTFGEAAYDVSAASGEAGEAYICEMLERAGHRWWQMEQAKGKLFCDGSVLVPYLRERAKNVRHQWLRNALRFARLSCYSHGYIA